MGVTYVTDGLDTVYAAAETEKVFFAKLDEALDDIEHGRVLTEEQLWEEVDAV